MKETTPASKRKDSLSRTERKDLTRASLLQAALALIGEGRSFTSLALREIAPPLCDGPWRVRPASWLRHAASAR